MIEIPEIEKVRFPTDWFFQRTEKVREKIEDCTREELIDLTSYLMTKFSEVQGKTEAINLEMEEILGWHDPLKK